ncbi:Multidrug resistance-associated protein 4 [Liparis tanakae]|uniref:Multidrug resistance-associated protein 4 n=1 Tax=Liparis tanakae TaxID=230148 RepID=A0A4Z2DZD3_9TELE|nr:Multidrug resistance-associated protein 4 [Liparis tanakae]
MTSVERVVEYAELQSEAPWETDRQPPHDWPQAGSITFDRVNFSYSVNEPSVLKNLTVVFSSREKVIVFLPTCARSLVCTACDSG